VVYILQFQRQGQTQGQGHAGNNSTNKNEHNLTLQAGCALNIAVKCKLLVSNLKLQLRYSIYQHVNVSTQLSCIGTQLHYMELFPAFSN
jgi:hypothetical protein